MRKSPSRARGAIHRRGRRSLRCASPGCPWPPPPPPPSRFDPRPTRFVAAGFGLGRRRMTQALHSRVVTAAGAGDLVESSWLLLGVGQGSSAHLVGTLPECNLHLNAKTRTWLHDQKRNVMTCHSSSRFELLLSLQSARYGHKKMKLIVFSYRRQTSTDHKEQQQAPDSFPQHRSGYQLKLEIKYISTVVRKPVCAKQLANNMQGGRIC